MSLLRTTTTTTTTAVVRQLTRTPTRFLRTFASAANPASTSGPWAERPTAPRLNRYLVVAEDCSDSGANARRFEVRECHLEQAQLGKRAGRIELGGALLKKDFKDIDEELGPWPHMAGSVLVVLGESIEDVRERVMQDEYVQGNVWDVEKLKIYPFLQVPLRSVESESGEKDVEGRLSENSNATLGQLRQDLAAGKGPKMVTLGALRRMHQSVYRADK